MVEANVKVYVLQPSERFDSHRRPLKPGWWWSVAVELQSPDERPPLSDTAWAPDRAAAWAAALVRLAELKEGIYA
jgi:hypothetical protein